MSRLTTDPNDPRLGHGVDDKPVPQNEAYLVLSAEERSKGFVRPVRSSYIHVGDGPKYPLRDLTEEEKGRHGPGYTKFEQYPESELPVGRAWKDSELVAKGCGYATSMGLELAETYARNPHFYGSTYCVHCARHLPVREFVWQEDGERVGS